MKLAVTAQNGQVFQHFGKCPSFAVFTVEGKAASDPVLLDATGSGHAAMAGFLKNNGVDTVICGGIGAPAKQMLLDQGIQVVSGASGDIGAAVQAFLDGTLKDSVLPTCTHHHGEHEHEHNCDCGSHGAHRHEHCGGHHS
ncbi:MAG: NifB/NifX family molybdenum-iron cluster-binding protein [Christensenellales bacterium]